MAVTVLEASNSIDIDAPLKAAPKLVAPEPGLYAISLSFFVDIFQNIVLALSLISLAKATLVQDVLTSKSAPVHLKDRIQISQSSLQGLPQFGTKSLYYLAKVGWGNLHSQRCWDMHLH